MTLLVFGMTQNALCGGLIFGWASIDQSILSESPENGGAGLRLDQTTKIFTWATSISMVAALILGAVLDYSGPRLASMTACLTIALGFLVFSFSDSMVGFAVGTILIGFGGPGIGNCIIHLAQLFPRNQNLAMSCLSGSIAFSFSMFAVFDSLWTQYPDLSFRRIFRGYSIVLLLLAFGAAMLYPDEPYEELLEDDDDLFEETEGELVHEAKPLVEFTREAGADHHKHPGHAAPHISFVVEQPFNSYLRDQHRMAQRTDSYRASKKSMEEGGPPMSLKDESFWNQLISADYLRSFLVFMVTTFVTNFYVVSLSTEVRFASGPRTRMNLVLRLFHHLTLTVASVERSAELLDRETTRVIPMVYHHHGDGDLRFLPCWMAP
jgi:MFS family permease